MLADLTHIAVHWDYETEQAHPFPAEPGDHDADEADVYEVDIPTDAWQAFEAACTAYFEARDAVLKAAGFDNDAGRMAECCAEWVGYEKPDKRSWSIVVTPPVAVEGWPQLDAYITRFDDEGAARAFVAELPLRFHIMNGRGLHVVHRSRVKIEEREDPGYSSDCHRCGWEREEHERTG